MQREERDDDAAWRAIVENYGERAEVAEPDAPETVEQASPSASTAWEGWDELDRLAAAEEQARLAEPDPDEDRFVPPPPPPLPRIARDKVVAWAGVVLAPIALALIRVLGVRAPLGLDTFVNVVLFGCFLAGFGYLVWRMPHGSEDPYDDGSRL